MERVQSLEALVHQQAWKLGEVDVFLLQLLETKNLENSVFSWRWQEFMKRYMFNGKNMMTVSDQSKTWTPRPNSSS